MKKHKHYVYFFVTQKRKKDDDRFLKIGYSTRWKERFWNLNTATPYKLCVLNVIPFYNKYDATGCEAWLHRIYSSFRVNGEWFRFTEEVKDYLSFDYIRARVHYRGRFL